MPYESIFTQKASEYVMAELPLGEKLTTRELTRVKNGLAARGEYYTVDQIRNHVRSRRKAKSQHMRYKRLDTADVKFDPRAHREARHYRGSFDL